MSISPRRSCVLVGPVARRHAKIFEPIPTRSARVCSGVFCQIPLCFYSRAQCAKKNCSKFEGPLRPRTDFRVPVTPQNQIFAGRYENLFCTGSVTLNSKLLSWVCTKVLVFFYVNYAYGGQRSHSDSRRISIRWRDHCIGHA